MSKTILLAEDESFIAMLIKQHLEQRGEIKVKIVGNGKQALAAIEKEHFDLILLDLIMPVMDGYQVLSHLKEHPIVTPIVVLSNLGMESDREKCMSLGASAYIVKANNDAPAIFAAIEKYLRS